MTSCITTPARPASPGTPTRVVSVPAYGWDAGANSVRTVTGDLQLRFTMGSVLGAVIGLVPDRDNTGDMARITHGFLFNQGPDGSMRYAVIESGVVRRGSATYTSSTEFKVVRTGSQVVYLVDGAPVYASVVPCVGAQLCGCALYASNDGVPDTGW